MKFTLVLVLTVASLASTDDGPMDLNLARTQLGTVLKDPKLTRNLFNSYLESEHRSYSPCQLGLRLDIFKKNAKMVAEANADPKQTATFGFNLFSDMTDDEKDSYKGLNATGHLNNDEPALQSVGAVPDRKMWLDKTTQVVNQGGCGSCWTFGATGPLETRYAIKSGTLRDFSESEYLDCLYTWREKDGCAGGWPSDAWTYSANNGGRLASLANYPYVDSVRQCRSRQTDDDMIEYKITGPAFVHASEQSAIQALSEGSVMMAFYATGLMQAYRSGIYSEDATCPGSKLNHAVTGVGYTPEYVLVKNSWGKYWGDNGFIKFARGHNNCNLFLHVSYPRLGSYTGRSETEPSDPRTDYGLDDATEEPPVRCEDEATNCSSNVCGLYNIEKWCAKTCNKCDDTTPDGECAPGTIRCSNGECLHEHMCPH